MRMKGKLRVLGQIGLALVMILSLGLVAASPAVADGSVQNVSVWLSNYTVGTEAEYEITFTPNVGLYPPGNVIIFKFPAGTYVPSSISTDDVMVRDLTDGEEAHPSAVMVEYEFGSWNLSGWSKVTVWLPDYSDPPVGSDVEIDYQHVGQVEFAGPPSGAGIINPDAAGQYCINVSTDEEPTEVPACYDIITGPVDIYLKWQDAYADCGMVEYSPHVGGFQTIQEALDYADEIFMGNTEWPTWDLYASCPGDYGRYIGAVIVVQPKVYYETIEIDTPGIELVSADGPATTIIDGFNVCPSHGVPAVVYISTGGVTFNGFTVRNGGGDLYYWDCGVDWDIDDDNYQDIHGIFVDADASEKSAEPIDDCMAYAYDARVNIVNNVITMNQASGIIAADSTVLVRDNEVYENDWNGFYGTNLHCGVEICDPEAYTHGCSVSNEILENEFYLNGDDGIDIDSAYGCDQDIDLYIVGNLCSQNGDDGIYLQEYATGDYSGNTVISIKFNQIQDNYGNGITTAAMYPFFNIACVYNNIAGNAVWGIKNWVDSQLIAKMNWWGDLSGPSDGVAPAHPTESNPDQTAEPPALGMGDAVSHYVIYQWWLTDEFENVQIDLIRYYGSDRYQGMGNDPWWSYPWEPIISFEEGWNTLSVPMALDENADELGEILALGGWMQNMIIGYSYDPVNGWQQLLSDSQILPLEAVYVKMSGEDLFPVLLRTTMWLPTRDLQPGWNLVGLNGAIWSEDFNDIITSKSVQETLVSIDGSWSTAISPSMPGQIDSWVCTKNNADSYNMYVGDGYWVFVTEPTTLAGFSVAPSYLNDWEMDILSCKLPVDMVP